MLHTLKYSMCVSKGEDRMSTVDRASASCTSRCQDLEESVRFYRDVLGLPHLFTVRGAADGVLPGRVGAAVPRGRRRTRASGRGRSSTTRSRTSSRRTPR